MEDNGTIRSFEGGATRDTGQNKYTPWKFGSAVIRWFYAQYMHDNRKQSDGSTRDGANWKKGIPIDVYYDSLDRHYQDVMARREELITEKDQITNLCALKFNVDGLIHELGKERIDSYGGAIIKWYED